MRHCLCCRESERSEPYLYRALPFAMSCENWDAEQFQHDPSRIGLRAPKAINRFLAAFRIPLIWR